MPVNRRRHPRVRAKGLAAHVLSSQGRVPCVVENISLGGIFVRTDKVSEVGEEVSLNLVKPGWKRALMLRARVSSRFDVFAAHVAQRPPGMGLQFVAVNDDQFDRLRKALVELGAPDEQARRAMASTAPRRAPVQPLDPQPEPLWRQVEHAAQEAGAHLHPGAPLDPNAFELTPEQPGPQHVALSPPDPDRAKLMMQIRGLVLQLSEAQQQIARRDVELERLRRELDSMRALALRGKA